MRRSTDAEADNQVLKAESLTSTTREDARGGCDQGEQQASAEGRSHACRRVAGGV
jgi:hypothetical protein